MALDSAAKRSSVTGVGRPWLRSLTVDAAKGEPWRHSVGNAYAAYTLQAPGLDIWTELDAPAATWDEKDAPAATWDEKQSSSITWTEN